MKSLLSCLTVALLTSTTTIAQTLPTIFPAPVSIELKKGTIPLADKSILLVDAPGTDPATTSLIIDMLNAAGVTSIKRVPKRPTGIPDRPYILIGQNDDPMIRTALRESSATPDSTAEGYTIAANIMGDGAIITLAGHDADGLFYAAQTFRQLIQRGSIPSLVINDHPAMPIRGTIEGFYGAPWSNTNRTKHLDFLAGIKANTYVYTPKDDPYARDKWREPYPAATLAELGKLVATAQRNHINFVYAISPGPSICYSDSSDLHAMEAKFAALRKIGVHSFYVALDDIEYQKWNCEKDSLTFGKPSAEAAGIAQSKMLNYMQASLKAHDPNARPLIMVPTEYYDAKESPYKAALRKHLDSNIVIQWTGTDVVPPAISTGDAKTATKAFGRKTLLWDNYPVNDYGQTAGRLLMAPYDKREAGLSKELSGILSNPMNQEAASRVAVTGVVAFAWNDKAYDANLTWHFAARELAGGDAATTEALLVFFDTQHMAPTFGSQPWQPQAPRLKETLDAVREDITIHNNAAQAIAELKHTAAAFTNVPDIIRAGVVDTAFAQEARPWLEAMQLWGRALQLTAAGLDAANQGSAAAARYFANAKQLAAEATAIQSIKGATRIEGPIKIADGVLDTFIADAPKLIAH